MEKQKRYNGSMERVGESLTAEAADREVEYKAFEMYFMQGMDYAKIAEELDTGNSTPRRWITAIINELSVLLWGMDEDKIK